MDREIFRFVDKLIEKKKNYGITVKSDDDLTPLILKIL